MDFIMPYTMLVSGQSGCGKTFWVSKLIQETKHLFDDVILAYTMYQDVYEELGVTLVYGYQ
jgi:septin family protein